MNSLKLGYYHRGAVSRQQTAEHNLLGTELGFPDTTTVMVWGGIALTVLGGIIIASGNIR